MNNERHNLIDPRAHWPMSRERVITALSDIAAGNKNPEFAKAAQASRKTAAMRLCGMCSDEEYEAGYVVENGVARIPIVGIMVKYPSWWGASTLEIQETIGRALMDFQVKTIALVFDCPGGYGLGCSDLADYVAKVNGTGAGQKPIDAIISDLAASAGYWVASQCRSITCNLAGSAGCIGVYTVLVDDSKFWAEMGIDWQLISSGGVKGLGADGKITPELKADVQREINDSTNLFVAAVSRGRGMTPELATQLADGRSWIANEAKQLGLIDNVLSVEDAMAALLEEISTMPISPEQFKAHAAENPAAAEVQALVSQGFEKGKAEHAPKAATAQQLKSIAGVGADFVLGQLEAGATLEAAAVAGCKHLGEQLAKSGTDHAAALAAQDTAHKAAIAAKDAEITRIRAEGGQGPVGTRGLPAGGAPEPAAAADPKKTAETEWEANDGNLQDKWVSKDVYIKARLRELAAA